MEKWLSADMTDHMKETFYDLFLRSRILFSIQLKDTELLVIEVHVKKIIHRQTIFSDLIHRSIPYPVLLLETLDDKWFKVSITETHQNSRNSFREVVEKNYASRWVQYEDFEKMLDDIEKNLNPTRGKEYFLNKTDELLLDYNFQLKMRDYGSADYERLAAHYREDHGYPDSYISRLQQIISMYDTVDLMDDPYSGYYGFLENLRLIAEQLEHAVSNPFQFGGDKDGEEYDDYEQNCSSDSSMWGIHQMLFSESEAIEEELNGLNLAMKNAVSSPITERILEINALLLSLIEEMQSIDFSDIAYS